MQGDFCFMKQIQLGGRRRTKIKGYAIVDDEDFDYLNQFKWGIDKVLVNGKINNFYVKKRGEKGSSLRMHRLIMNPPKGMVIDHINGNGLDNRRRNLRICTQSQNMQNQKKGKGSSIYKGVYLEKKHKYKKYLASIKLDKKNIFIGYFHTEHQAALAYDLWANDLFGKFAKTNFKRAI